MFQFNHIEYLFFMAIIPIIIILFWLSGIRKKRLLKEFGDPLLMQELMPDHSKTRPILKLIFLLLALTFFILGLAGPEFGTKLQQKKHRGVEIIIALDVSNSMMAEDIQPSRLERAKQAISKMVDDLQNDRIGLIVFAQVATRRMKEVPEGAQNFWEWMVESLHHFLEGIIGHHLVQRTFWFFASIFIFILFAFEYIASGHLFPLDILPSGLAAVLSFTPFPYQLFFPVSIYMGKVTGAGLVQGLAIQFCWVLLAYALARLAWARGVKHYSAVGG